MHFFPQTKHRRPYEHGKRKLSLKSSWELVALPNGAPEHEHLRVEGGPDKDKDGEYVYRIKLRQI